MPCHGHTIPYQRRHQHASALHSDCVFVSTLSQWEDEGEGEDEDEDECDAGCVESCLMLAVAAAGFMIMLSVMRNRCTSAALLPISKGVWRVFIIIIIIIIIIIKHH